MQNINVNIVPDNFPQTIRYSQGDIGRQFKINVTDFEIPVGATVKIQATKPSGFGFSVAGVVAGSSVTFTTTAEMTDEAGRFQAKLQITAGDDVIGTANFLMIGERNPHPEGTTDGSQGTIIPELTLLVERVEKAASDVLDMEVVANTLPAGSQATYSYDEALNKATFGIPEGQAGAGAAGVVASAYSAAKTYKVGDYVLYNSNLYRCTTAITTAEAWTAAHWTQVVLADDVTDLKTDLDDKILDLETEDKTKKSVTLAKVVLSEDNVSNVNFYTEEETHVYGLNRLDIANANVTHDGYASTVITKTDTGINIKYVGGGTFKYAYISYTAEFDGDLRVSCKASTTGNIRECFMVVQKNGNNCAFCYGEGLLKEKITVETDDVIRLMFCMRAQATDAPNELTYDDIMVSYTDSDFVPFNDYTNKEVAPDYTLPHNSIAEWNTSTPASGVSGINVFLSDSAKANMPAGLPIPPNLNAVPVGLTVKGLDLVTYSNVYNGIEGLGVSTSGRVMIYVSGCSTQEDYLRWLAEHEVTLTYLGNTFIVNPFDGSNRKFVTGEIIEFAEPTAVEYYYKNVVSSKVKMVCFGDSCTGMFGYDTDYPSMITESSKIEAINCGFSGSCWTDYTGGIYVPFSINRLIDSIVAEDFSTQDAVISQITSDWYAEHLANLKAVNWSEVKYVTFFAGVNDWYYAINKLYSTDDPNTENKQRTNIEDCVPYCITQLLTKYPHLKIIVLTPYHAFMQNVDSDTTPNNNGNYLYQYAEVIEKCSHDKRMPCIEQYKTSGINQLTMYYYTSDGTHPNEPMKHMIAKRIIKYASDISENDMG